MRALHGSEVAARVVGVDVTRYKGRGLSQMSAMFAGLMGSVTAHYVGFVRRSPISAIPSNCSPWSSSAAWRRCSARSARCCSPPCRSCSPRRGLETSAYGAVLVPCMIFPPKRSGADARRPFREEAPMSLLEVVCLWANSVV